MIDARNTTAAALVILAATGTASAQACTQAFELARRTAVGQEPRSLALGDIDGDGDIDAVTGNTDTEDVSVLLNDGAGTMVVSGSVPMAGGPLDVGLADLNGDGHLDVVTEHGVALGNGDGTFQAAMPFAVDLGEAPQLALADLDGDGDLDLAFARPFDESIVLLGNGDGTFGDPIVVTSGQRCLDVVLSDVDGDGDHDLLFAANADVVLVVNDGGEFAPPQLFRTGGTSYHLTTGDLNEDGVLDVLTTNYTNRTASVLLGDGAGGFGPPTLIDTIRTNFEVELIDVNADGHLDAITANASGGDVGVLLGDGAGGFGTPRLYKLGLRVVDLAVADMNGDGVLDIVAGDAEGDALVVLDGHGDGGFAAPQALVSRDEPSGVDLGDVDADGDADIVMIQSSPERLVTFLRDASGYRGISATTRAFQFSFGGVVLRDVDGDGIDDAIVERNFDIYRGAGDGTFVDPVRLDYNLPRIADLDGDGRLDAVAIDGDQLVVLLADEGFGLIETSRIDVPTAGLELADADLDGDIDLFTMNALSGVMEVYTNDGLGAFALGSVTPLAPDPVSPRLLFVGDVDGDGDPDVITAGTELDVLVNDGQGGFAAPRSLGRLGTAQVASGLGAIDADGDGILDLVVATSSSAGIPARVLLRPGLGGALFGPAQTIFLGNSFQDLTIGDTNADGIDDLLVVDTDDSVSIILGQCVAACRADLDGDGVLTIFDFLAFQNAFDAGDPIADFDGDGELTIFDFLAFQNAFDAGCP